MHTAPHVYAYAFDVRHVETDTLLGVGLIVPPERHVSFLAESTRMTVSPQLPPSLWDAIAIWDQETRDHATVQPAQVPPEIVSAILDTDVPVAVTAQRFAAIPVSERSRDHLADGRLLQGLMSVRRADS